jgi:hypothetical protein
MAWISSSHAGTGLAWSSRLTVAGRRFDQGEDWEVAHEIPLFP